MENEIGFQEGLEKYWNNLITNIPCFVFQMLLNILCVGLVLFMVWKGVRKGFLYSIRLILVEFIFIILSSTVIFRKTDVLIKYDFYPFWSYFAIKEGEEYLLVQNIMNVVIFIPIGFLLGCGFPKLPWWKVIGTGFLFSLTIETLQFTFKREFCELDDVIHNTLGCAIGVGIIKLIMFAHSTFCKTELIKKVCHYDNKMDI